MLVGPLNVYVEVAAVPDTRFTCEVNCWVLEDDFVVFSAFGSRCSAWLSQLVERIFNAIVHLVFADDGGRLVVTIKSSSSVWSRFMRPTSLERGNTESNNKLFSLWELKEAIQKSHNTAVGPDEIHYKYFRQLPSKSSEYILTALNNI